MSDTVSKKDFAALLGVSKSYVSQLIANKRLALTEDGRRVLVDASLELLGASADPSKEGVRERWAAMRAERQAAADAPPPAAQQPLPMVAAAPAANEPVPPAADVEAAAAKNPARSAYQDARTLREQAEAERAQIELMRLRGRVLEAEGTLRAISDAHAAVRAELLGQADRLAQLLAAEMNPRKVWDILTDDARRMAGRIEEQVRRMVANREGVTA